MQKYPGIQKIILIAIILFCSQAGAATAWDVHGTINITIEPSMTPYVKAASSDFCGGNTFYANSNTTLDFCFGSSHTTVSGNLYIKQNLDGGRYRLASATGTSWLNVNLKGTVQSGTYDGYHRSDNVQFDNSTASLTLNYRERARYTQNYNFDDGYSYDATVSQWTNVGTTINVSAPKFSGYLCTGWNNGTNTFAASGSDCATGNKSLLSDKITANQLTWQYTKAWRVETKVSGGPPAVLALVETPSYPYADSSRHLIRHGTTTVAAQKIIAIKGDRWRLAGYTATGSLGGATISDDTPGTYELTFNLTADTTVTWNYVLEHKVTIQFEGSVPAGVRTSAELIPEAGNVWVRDGARLKASAASQVIDASTGISYRCGGWTGTGSIPASGTAASLSQPITARSGIAWKYGRINKITVDAVGLPPAVKAAHASSFAMPIGDTFLDLNSKVTLKAPPILYESYNGQAQAIRYVLTGWSGTGDVPATGATGSSGPFTLSQDSSITWSYDKEVLVTVTTFQLTDPALAVARECSTAPIPTQCVDWANASPPGAIDSGANYYPVNAKITATALFSVVDGADTKTNAGTLVTGTIPFDWYETVYNGRRLVSFTLTNPLEVQWRYDSSLIWTVGQAIMYPGDATADNVDLAIRPIVTILSADPDATVDNSFVWSPVDTKLYPLRPITSANIMWAKTTGGYTQLYTAMSQWPMIRQRHIAHVPVNLQPPGSPYAFVSLKYPFVGPSIVDNVFTSDTPGAMSVLLFAEGPAPNTDLYPLRVLVVQTQAADSLLVDDADCTIGADLTGDAYGHGDPEGKNGYILDDRAAYDGTGSDRAHDRATRSGNIIPVNRTTAADAHPLKVVWFEKTEGGLNLGWPVQPVRYACSWPSDPETIVIAGGQGSGPLTANPNAQIYNQPDPSLAGYNPNEEHALVISNTAYALRNDLNALLGNQSEPYVLLKYKTGQDWHMRVFRVVDTDSAHNFSFDVEAGSPILPLSPIGLFPLMTANNRMADGADWHHEDHKHTHWAKAANWKDGDAINDIDKSRIVMHWYYPMQPGFYLPGAKEGDPIPFLNGTTAADTPVGMTYVVKWPVDVKVLPVGDTLVKSKNGLPDLSQQAAAEVLFDEGMHKEIGPLAKLIDALGERSVTFDPGQPWPNDLVVENRSGKLVFTALPYYLQSRLSYDPTVKALSFRGTLADSGLGEPLLLPNIMTSAERDVLLAQSTNTSWDEAIASLYDLTRNPSGTVLLPGSSYANPFKQGVAYSAEVFGAKWGLLLGLQQDSATGTLTAGKLTGVPMALTAGGARGEGYLTLAFNDDAALGALPVSLQVIRVEAPPVTGEIKVIEPDCAFDEKLTLRHSADFGGDPGNLVFEWYYKPDTSGVAPVLPSIPGDKNGWTLFARGAGLQSITIEGPGPLTLSDNWFMVRYYYKDAYSFLAAAASPSGATALSDPQDLNNWSSWSGAPGNQTAQLAEGWIKRVFNKLNLFDARVTDFSNNAANTLVSMISQIGPGYTGAIALNCSADNLNNIGMLQAYMTVLDRGEDFSVDAGYNYGPANSSLLNAGTRIADFNMLLGNEAYADAQDPTIGFTTKSSRFGSAAPTIFSFENQLDSLLEEELALLRGRDDSLTGTRAWPVYNRLVWNFTQGDGEVAYVTSYNITDQNTNGIVDEADAQLMYPQGHGDAWGYYLSAIKTYYGLLGKPNFTWEPRAESVLVGGAPITVDYLDERKFARIAAAKARAGSEIVDLTYRKNYVDDPAGQWQGYKDTDAARAWGVDDWARRAGQGAYFDWVMANALLPATDTNPGHAGITKIDRTTVTELDGIASQYRGIQARMDKADRGLNPLGLAKGVVPFDIDPALISKGQSHFEQIYDRATASLANAVAVFDYANDYTKMLRYNQNSLEDFKRNIYEQELDYQNRLIELFGYPFAEDIGTGSGKAYPAGYDGPDVVHYLYIDVPELTGTVAAGPVNEYTVDLAYQDLDTELFDSTLDVAATPRPTSFVVPTEWGWPSKPAQFSKRRATGKIQNALSEVIKAQADFNRGLKEFEVSLGNVEGLKDELETLFNVKEENISIVDASNTTVATLGDVQFGLERAAAVFRMSREAIETLSQISSESLPKSVGMATDAFAPVRGAIKSVAYGSTAFLRLGEGLAETGQNAIDLAIRDEYMRRDKKLYINDARYDVQVKVGEMGTAFIDALGKQESLYGLRATIAQRLGELGAVIAEGERLLEERRQFRKNTAGDVQSYRYEDMAFRVFRNDALQKYRAQFDLAARYVYLAATAYDYETNLLGTDAAAGRKFITDIVRQRSLGAFVGALPLSGRPGLADPMARMSQNFSVYKGQLGFNNPQTETNRFSLRSELFRIRQDLVDDGAWRDELMKYRVADVWHLPEFKRYCRPFAPESAGPQPAIVIPFSSEVVFGNNYFGWPLGGGDSAYDPSHFATKIRSTGIWFKNYNAAGLSYTPRVYLVPVGADVLRSPSGDGFSTRVWEVVDQKLPPPNPIGASDLTSEKWIPQNDSLMEDYGGIRRLSSFRAYHDSGSFSASETVSDSRLVGRSVWNTQWLLIIPGGTLLNDPDAGLDTFINTVDDIKLFFQTYSYSGN